MHDGMPYDLIQGQCQSHEPLKVGNPIFKIFVIVLIQKEIQHESH